MLLAQPIRINLDGVSQVERLGRRAPGRTIGLRVNQGAGRRLHGAPLVRRRAAHEVRRHRGPPGRRDRRRPPPRARRGHAALPRRVRLAGRPARRLRDGARAGDPVPGSPARRGLRRSARSTWAAASGAWHATASGRWTSTPTRRSSREHLGPYGVTAAFEPGDLVRQGRGPAPGRGRVAWSAAAARRSSGLDIGWNVNCAYFIYRYAQEILPVRDPLRERTRLVTVAGHINEAGDLFAEDYPFPEVEEGEVVAVLNAGRLSPGDVDDPLPAADGDGRLPGPGVDRVTEDAATAAAAESAERPSLERQATRVRVTAWRAGVAETRDDRLAGEEPMAIRACGPGQDPIDIAVTMRTPGHEAELAAGFLLTEGLIDGRGDIVAIDGRGSGDPRPPRRRGRGPPGPAPGPGRASRRATSWPRRRAGSAARRRWTRCEVRCAPIPDGPVVAPETLLALPARLREGQAVFGATGGLHAAGLFTPDGHARRAARGHRPAQRPGQARREPAARRASCRSTTGSCSCPGRASFELVQKAAVAGHPAARRRLRPERPRRRGRGAAGRDPGGLPARRRLQRLRPPGPGGDRAGVALLPDGGGTLRPAGRRAANVSPRRSGHAGAEALLRAPCGSDRRRHRQHRLHVARRALRGLVAVGAGLVALLPDDLAAWLVAIVSWSMLTAPVEWQFTQ